jgi:hypothetical protein
VWYHPQNVQLRSLAPNNTWTIRTLKGRKMCLLSKTHMPFYANAKEIYKILVWICPYLAMKIFNQNFQNIDRHLFASAAASIYYHIVPCTCSGLFNLEVNKINNNVTIQLFKMATSIFHWKELQRSKLNANFEPKSTLPGISREGIYVQDIIWLF